jgi:hypothetical protein
MTGGFPSIAHMLIERRFGVDRAVDVDPNPVSVVVVVLWCCSIVVCCIVLSLHDVMFYCFAYCVAV